MEWFYSIQHKILDEGKFNQRLPTKGMARKIKESGQKYFKTNELMMDRVGGR
jgi:hypothetical protein